MGKYVWAKSVEDSSGKAIEVDEYGNSYVAGSTSNSACAVVQCACLTKLDPNGKLLWTAHMGQGGSQFGSYGEYLTMDKAGNSYMAGPFSGSVKFGSQTLSAARGGVFVTKLDPKGKVLWAVRANRPFQGFGTHVLGLALDHKGNTYVTGAFSGKVDFGTVTVDGGGGHVFVWKLASGIP